MNFWTIKSIELANQKNYLDLLYRVYPISPNIRRDIDEDIWNDIKTAFKNKNNKVLIEKLLNLDLFPIKDCYVAYLRKDRSAIERNPLTIDRISGQLYEMGLDEVFNHCSEPKETNRQIGPMFKEWIGKKSLGATVYTSVDEFINSNDNGVLNVGDEEMKNFAKKYLGYGRNKGLDFIARFNKNYVIGEAKFITDFGGHQNAQFNDAVQTAKVRLSKPKIKCSKVISIAILDGVVYIPGKHKFAKYFENHEGVVVVSSLLLREFLYSL